MPNPSYNLQTHSRCATPSTTSPAIKPTVTPIGPKLTRASSTRDATLFQLCAQFHQLELIVQDSWDLEDPEFWGNLLEEQTVLSTKICNMRPTTLMGYRAVARALVGWLPSMHNDEIADLNGRDANLLAFLLQHLVEDDP